MKPGGPVRLCQAGNRFMGSLKGLKRRALAGLYDNPIPNLFLAPLDCSKIPEPVFVNLLKSPGIHSQPGGPVRQPFLTYQPDRLYIVHRLAEESFPRVLKRLQIRGSALNFVTFTMETLKLRILWPMTRHIILYLMFKPNVSVAITYHMTLPHDVLDNLS
jgi:hypothetical protein